MKPGEILRAIAGLTESERRRLLANLGKRYPAQVEPTPSATATDAADVIVTFDGGSRGNPGPGYGSFALSFGGGGPEVSRLTFGRLTNNEAEYRTLIGALEALLDHLKRRGLDSSEITLEIRGDSALVIQQVKGEWQVKEPRLRALRDSARTLLGRFRAARLVHSPRAGAVKLFGH